MEFKTVNTTAELEDLAQYLLTLSAFAFDTEFDRHHHAYGFQLCLVQIGTPNGCFVIDPMQLKDLSPLWKVMNNADIQKVIHDSNEDLQLIYLHGCRTKNVFDTSTAVKLLGFEKTGLGTALMDVLGVESSKGSQRSNWTIRPLTHQQLSYAANDVRHLLPLRDALEERLETEKRLLWFKQVMSKLEKRTYEPESKTDFLTTIDRRSLSPTDQLIKNEFYKFRDYHAERLNKPVHQIINKDLLADIVANPSLIDRWETLGGIHHKLKNEKIAVEVSNIYQKAIKRAESKGLSTQKERLSPEEAQQAYIRRTKQEAAKKEIFDPIKQQLVEKFGMATSTQILSNDLITNLITNQMRITEIDVTFQQQAIIETAQYLGITLDEYL